MYIKNLKIKNFRNFHKADINFNSEDNIIIGDNGSGKTNLFNAIRLVLDVNCKLEYFFCEKDFNYNMSSDIFGNWIIISVQLTDFSEEDSISRFDFQTNQEGDAYINFIFKPKDRILESLFEMYQELEGMSEIEVESKKQEMKTFIENLHIETDYEVIRTFNKMFDYFNEDLYKQVIGDFDNLVFNDNYRNTQYIGVVDRNINNALKQINITYIPPIRDVRENLASSNGMFAKLINESYDEISEDDKNEITGKVVDLNQKISSIAQFQDLKSDMYANMDIVGKNYFDSKFEIESNISNDKKEMVKSLSLKIQDHDNIVDIWRKSLGEANIIYFAMQLLESEKRQSTFRSKILDLLLIEEPEAHIHGHLQKALFKNLRENKSRQLLISTHSVNISEVSKISKMIILNDDYRETNIYNPSKELSEKEVRRIERYLDANRSMLLFSQNVILVEGDAENIIIPWLIYKNFGITLDEMGISLVSISSTFFKALLPLFAPDRIRKKCAVITDLDTDYTSDNSKQNAQSNGQTRKVELDNISSNNEFIDIYYAENTFEIQLLESDTNKPVLINMVNSDDNIIYSSQSKKQEIIRDLNIDLKKKETIMKIVEYNKKGWFALDFIEYCEENNLTPEIPPYILNALKWIVINEKNFKLTKWSLLSIMAKDSQPQELLHRVESCHNFEELRAILSDVTTINVLLNFWISEINNVN